MKKVISVLITAIIAVSNITMASATSVKRLIGDVNYDSVISIVDATSIQKYLVDLDEFDEETLVYADTDGNESISIVDATNIQKYISDLISEFPAKEPEITDPIIKNVIPEGGQVTLRNGTVYNAGEDFPENQHQMSFIYGDYKYTYDMYQYGWSVRAIDESKSTYGEILENINGAPVNDMQFTFSGCYLLETAPVIPESVLFMESTFKDCKSLTEAPIIPQSVVYMFNTFYGCTSLEVAPELPRDLEVLTGAFDACTSLKTAPVIPYGVTDMKLTFAGCTALTEAPVIPDSVTNLSWAFAHCNNLAKVSTISNNVIDMSYAFYGCYRLRTVPAIPKSVTNMEYTFEDCLRLAGVVEINAENLEYYDSCFLDTQGEILLTGEYPELNELSTPYNNVKVAKRPDPTYVGTGNIIPENSCVYLSDGTLFKAGEEFPVNETGMVFAYGEYEYTYNGYYFSSGGSGKDDEQNGWGVQARYQHKTKYDEILENINDAPITNMDSTFYGCLNLIASPEIPKGVTNMNGTFEQCRSFKDAPEIPNGVIDMTHTFHFCTALEVAPAIPNSVICMHGTFSQCESLTSAPVIPDSVEDMIGTFTSCTSLTVAPEIPNSVTHMQGTFEQCTSLKVAPAIPDSVRWMNYTFSECSSLTEAPKIADGVLDMTYAFAYCYSLETAPVIPSSVTSINSIFKNCNVLQGTVEINAKILYDYSDCFYNTYRPITLTGDYSKLNDIAKKYWNVSVD